MQRPSIKATRDVVRGRMKNEDYLFIAYTYSFLNDPFSIMNFIKRFYIPIKIVRVWNIIFAFIY